MWSHGPRVPSLPAAPGSSAAIWSTPDRRRLVGPRHRRPLDRAGREPRRRCPRSSASTSRSMTWTAPFAPGARASSSTSRRRRACPVRSNRRCATSPSTSPAPSRRDRGATGGRRTARLRLLGRSHLRRDAPPATEATRPPRPPTTASTSWRPRATSRCPDCRTRSPDHRTSTVPARRAGSRARSWRRSSGRRSPGRP